MILDVPVELSREAARAAARAELADPLYQQDQPSLAERVLTELVERLQELLDRAAEVSPGGYVGLIVLVLLAVLAGIALRLRAGPLGRGAQAQVLLPDRSRSAAEHRAAADRYAAEGAWAEAVRERLRALVRGLEERGLLEPRPGRTADEAAAEASSALPGQAAALREAARLFDEVWYGGRPATPATDARLREIESSVRSARPAGVSAPGPPASQALTAAGAATTQVGTAPEAGPEASHARRSAP